MQAGKPSFMAEAVALFRAAHQLIDDDPKIFDDPLAVKILGPDTEQTVAGKLDSLNKSYLKKARALVLVRSRITEDELLKSIGRGVTQYVILGAGLDTSAYRALPGLEKISVLEVDHPDTQQWKLQRLSEAGIEPPGNLRFVPADFNRMSLEEILGTNGFDATQPAFFSWLGVCCYLERPAVNALFDYVAGLAPHSQIVFDFLMDNSALEDKNAQAIATASKVGRQVGEPWITAFDPTKLEQILRHAGFSQVSYLSAELINQRYLNNRTDGLLIDPAMPVMSAIV